MEEYDVESILDMYEDDYVPESRPMMAGGGQLVQPSADGSRPGYNGRGGPRPNTGGDRSQYIDYKARIENPGKKFLDIAEKVHGNKPEYKDLKGFELWKELKDYQRSNIKQKQTTGEPSVKLKKNQIGKDDFIKLVNQNKDKTYNQFVEILKSANNVYFVYEYCNEGTLENVLFEKKFLKEKEAIKIFKQLLNAFKTLSE